MPLANIQVEKAKPRDKDWKLYDEKGLYLLIRAAGHKWWRFKYRYGGRADGKPGKAEKNLSLGVFPEVSLKRAREKRDEARRLLADHIDPGTQRKQEEHQRRVAQLQAFEAVAREWLTKQSWGESHGARNARRLEQHVFPWIGSLGVSGIKRAQIKEVLHRIERTGHIETAYRVLQLISSIFEYAVAEEICEHSPCQGLSKTLSSRPTRHHAAITDPKQVGELLRAIDGYGGTFPVACALRLAPLLFVRPGELRKADWSEFDLDGAHPQWRIPAARMKMREQHIVPLAKQAVAILRELQPLTGPTGLVFPGLRSLARPMSENTLNAALRRLGYDKDTMTAHGFRSLASSILNEQHWHKDAIERQLAHGERDKIWAAPGFVDTLFRAMMRNEVEYGTSNVFQRVQGIWPISWLCAALEVTCAGFYAWLMRPQSARAGMDATLTAQIQRSFTDSDRTYGARRVRRDLRDWGHRCGIHRVERLMRRAQLVARRRRRRMPFDIGPRAEHRIAPNVLERQFDAAAVNRKWVADFTYLWTAEGWLYVATVMDLFSRRIVGWSMSAQMTAQLVADALLMAIWRRGPVKALLHHSDQGSQYTSEQFQRLLTQHGITCSMSRSGNCWDNAAMESFFSTLGYISPIDYEQMAHLG